VNQIAVLDDAAQKKQRNAYGKPWLQNKDREADQKQPNQAKGSDLKNVIENQYA